MLLSFGVVLGFSLALKKIANQLGTKNEFSLHVVHDANLEAFKDKLASISNIKKYKLITKEEVFRDTTEMWQIELDDSFNTMPNTFIVQVKDPSEAFDTIKEIVHFKRSEIENIEFAPNLIKKIHGFKNILVLWGTVFSLLLATTTFVINFNTIELVIRVRREELRLLNFIGVPTWFIKGPFVCQGVMYAVAGSFLSYIGLILILSIISGALNTNSLGMFSLLVPSPMEFLNIALILFLTAVVFSVSSSIWATEQRLND